MSGTAPATPVGREAAVAVPTDLGVTRVDAATGRPVPGDVMAELDDTLWDITAGALPAGRRSSPPPPRSANRTPTAR